MSKHVLQVNVRQYALHTLDSRCQPTSDVPIEHLSVYINCVKSMRLEIPPDVRPRQGLVQQQVSENKGEQIGRPPDVRPLQGLVQQQVSENNVNGMERPPDVRPRQGLVQQQA